MSRLQHLLQDDDTTVVRVELGDDMVKAVADAVAKRIESSLIKALSQVKIPDHSKQLDRIEKMLEKGLK